MVLEVLDDVDPLRLLDVDRHLVVTVDRALCLPEPQDVLECVQTHFDHLDVLGLEQLYERWNASYTHTSKLN